MKEWMRGYVVALAEVEAAIASREVLDRDLEKRRTDLLMILGRSSEALDRLDRLRVSYPHNVNVFQQYARVAVPLGRLSSDDLREWAWQRRTDPTALTLYAQILSESGLYQQAIDQVKTALRIPRGMSDILNEMVYVGLYGENLNAAEFLGDLKAGVAAQFKPVSAFPKRVPGRRRYSVGFLSAATHEHPMFYFLAPLLNGLDRREFTVSVFTADKGKDHRTAQLESLVDFWYDVGNLNNAELLDLLREERLDVLIDLDNHTLNNRLWVMAQRAAPVQVSAYGLQITTAIPSIDYRITDWQVDPAGSESFYTESLLRTESLHFGYFCDDIDKFILDPVNQAGRVVVGSFNHMLKIGGSVIEFWVTMLLRFPQIELRIFSASNGVVVGRIVDEMEKAGISAERYSFYDRLAPYQLREHILQCDFAIDSWPFAGGVTTAMLMSYGIPVLTLDTPRAAGRLSLALNHELGLDNWTADRSNRLLEIISEKLEQLGSLWSSRQSRRDAFRSRVGDSRRVGADWTVTLLKAIEQVKK